MSKNNIPEIGDRIEIEVPNYLNEGTKKNLVSQIMDVIDENNFFVATPIVNSVLTPIPQGEIIKVRYAKKDSGVYVFNAEVISRKSVEHISYMTIKRVASISKTQRRNFFRLDVLLNVIVHREIGDSGKTETISTFAKDISGGGIRVISKKPLDLQSMVTLTIDTKNETIKVGGKIVRCSLFQIDEYDIGIIFEDIDETHRSKIISFIFEEQRKMRKKGLI